MVLELIFGAMVSRNVFLLLMIEKVEIIKFYGGSLMAAKLSSLIEYLMNNKRRF